MEGIDPEEVVARSRGGQYMTEKDREPEITGDYGKRRGWAIELESPVIVASRVSFPVSFGESFSVSFQVVTPERTRERTHQRTRTEEISRLAGSLALPHPGAAGTAKPAVR